MRFKQAYLVETITVVNPYTNQNSYLGKVLNDGVG